MKTNEKEQVRKLPKVIHLSKGDSDLELSDFQLYSETVITDCLRPTPGLRHQNLRKCNRDVFTF